MHNLKIKHINMLLVIYTLVYWWQKITEKWEGCLDRHVRSSGFKVDAMKANSAPTDVNSKSSCGK